MKDQNVKLMDSSEIEFHIALCWLAALSVSIASLAGIS